MDKFIAHIFCIREKYVQAAPKITTFRNKSNSTKLSEDLKNNFASCFFSKPFILRKLWT